MSRSRLLIVNPWASAVDEDRLAAVRGALPEGTELHLTTRRGEATDLAREVAGTLEALYVFGGDGTYNEVLNGIDGDTPMGFIPGGGASVLPRALGLPRDPVSAAQQLAVGSQRRIGLGRVNGHRFGFASGVGLDAELVRAVDDLGRKPDGKRPGDFAFAWSGVRVLSRHGFSLDPALEVKGHGRAAFALVSNGPTYTYAGRLALRPARQATFEGGLDLVGPTKVARAGWRGSCDTRYREWTAPSRTTSCTCTTPTGSRCCATARCPCRRTGRISATSSTPSSRPSATP